MAIRRTFITSALCAGLFLAPVGRTQLAEAAEENTEQAEPMASVAVAITPSDGDSIEVPTESIPWDSERALEVHTDGHWHKVAVSVKREGSSKLKLELAYALDEETVLRTGEVTARLDKPKVIKAPDGTFQLSVLIKRAAPPKRDTIDHPEDDDPLGGLE